MIFQSVIHIFEGAWEKALLYRRMRKEKIVRTTKNITNTCLLM